MDEAWGRTYFRDVTKLGVMLLASAAMASHVDQVADAAYSCDASLSIAGLSGGMWRDFYPGRPDQYYKIQLQNPEIETTPFALWLIDDRPPGPPRVYGFDVGRPEATIFEQGPDSVNFGIIPHDGSGNRRLWARLFGDGAYVGTILVQGGRQGRRAARIGARGYYLSIYQRQAPEIFARLAQAAQWRAELVDDSGRVLGTRSVRVPAAQEVRAAFVRAQQALLAARDAYLAGRAAPAADLAACRRMPGDEEGI